MENRIRIFLSILSTLTAMALVHVIFCGLCLLIIIINHKSEGNPTKFLYIDHVDCQFSKVYLANNASCKLTFINRTHKAITLKMFSIANFKYDQTIQYELFYRYRTGYRTFLVKVKDNYCDYVTEGSLKSKVLDLLIPAMKRYSNVNLTCPYLGPFSIEKMPLNADYFENPFIPVGKYYLNITLAYKNNLILSMQVYFTVPEGKTVEYDGLGR